MENIELETLFNDLPAENIKNSMELLKKCKVFCEELKLVHVTETPSNFIKKVKKLPSYLLSVLHYYCLYCKKHDKRSIKDEDKFYMTLLDIFKTEFYDKFKGRVTLTYGDVAESHAGMQNIGKKSKHGFSLADIQLANEFFKERGCETVIIHLNDFLPKDVKAEEAYLFIAKKGLHCLIDDDKGVELTTETQFFEWDAKMYNSRRKIVQNKNARHNLNFSFEKQKSDFEKGKGTTVPWEEVPLIYKTRKALIKAFGKSAEDLQCEGNLYYEGKQKTGIGYHGDTERRKVIGVRLGGKPMNIHYQWYHRSRPCSVNISTILQPGDVYCMSEKTVGTDWKSSSIVTLRHAAGADIYTTNGKFKVLNMRKSELYDDVTIGDVVYKTKKSDKDDDDDNDDDKDDDDKKRKVKPKEVKPKEVKPKEVKKK
jgi:hypothetical protein